LKFSPYIDDTHAWSKSISLDDTQLDLFPQLKTSDSVTHILNTVTEARFKCNNLFFKDIVRCDEYIKSKKRKREQKRSKIEMDEEIVDKKMRKMKIHEME